jgi:hypothetical protein
MAVVPGTSIYRPYALAEPRRKPVKQLGSANGYDRHIAGGCGIGVSGQCDEVAEGAEAV